jgi:excinuclease UvrABC ATPase subunit
MLKVLVMKLSLLMHDNSLVVWNVQMSIKLTDLSPVIAIEQKTTSKVHVRLLDYQPHDFLRLFYARAADAYSYW